MLGRWTRRNSLGYWLPRLATSSGPERPFPSHLTGAHEILSRWRLVNQTQDNAVGRNHTTWRTFTVQRRPAGSVTSRWAYSCALPRTINVDRPISVRRLFVQQTINHHREKDCLKACKYGFEIPDDLLPPSARISSRFSFPISDLGDFTFHLRSLPQNQGRDPQHASMSFDMSIHVERHTSRLEKARSQA